MIEVKREEAIKLYKNESGIKAWQEGVESAGKQVEAVIDAIKDLGVKATAINSKDFEIDYADIPQPEFCGQWEGYLKPKIPDLESKKQPSRQLKLLG